MEVKNLQRNYWPTCLIHFIPTLCITSKDKWQTESHKDREMNERKNMAKWMDPQVVLAFGAFFLDSFLGDNFFISTKKMSAPNSAMFCQETHNKLRNTSYCCPRPMKVATFPRLKVARQNFQSTYHNQQDLLAVLIKRYVTNSQTILPNYVSSQTS